MLQQRPAVCKGAMGFKETYSSEKPIQVIQKNG